MLFNWTWHLGMLRGVDEHELVVSLEYQGKGTAQVDGQPCTASKYRVSTNYQTPGQRTQITCTRASGQTQTTIEVVSGPFAWNEDIPGAEIVAGKGKAMPMPAATQERLIRLWAGPQGAPKAALLAARQTNELGPNPSVGIADGAMTSGSTSLTWEAGKPVVTFPVPGVPGATASATLDAKYMAEKVVVKTGREHHRVHLQRLSRLEQSAEPDRGVLRREDGGAPQRHRGARHHDRGDGNRQRVRGDAGAGEREEGHHADGAGASRSNRPP